MEVSNEIVIKVQELEPRLRHATIFQTYNNLKVGESLIIHNNHDPKPVYYQLQEMKGDTFDWEYLQEGPEWWDIRVTKNVEIQQGLYVTQEGEIVVAVPEIEPRLKHQTIFGVYEDLKPGESMIIHNDHDPKPVFYQLQTMHGDVFDWEYLQEGPQWWDIRVTKHNTSVYQTETGEIFIDIPSIAPKLKHQTIFEVFDSLEQGKSLIIHNDHDPKPVYYQLQGERGDIFTWEYLEQGPEWWNIKVTKKLLESTETLGEIVTKDYRAATILSKYGIDFCCNGKKTLQQACAEKGLDSAKIEKELQLKSENVTGTHTNYNEWDIDFLADYVIKIHHAYNRKYLPEILAYAKKVEQVHGDQHPELTPIREKTQLVHDEMLAHLVSEEAEIFPYVKQVVLAQNGIKVENPLKLDLQHVIDHLEEEHSSVGRLLEEIRELSDNYAIPSDACTSYKLLYKMLDEFEQDTHLHIHLENNILFPKTLELEKSLA